MPAAYEGTVIISCLRSKYIIRHSRISYRASDISLKNVTFYDKIPMKEGGQMQHNDWVIPFSSLDLCAGTLVPIINDGEDMLEIRWCDGMWIDVGYLKNEGTYYITTVSDDTLDSWNNPLSVIGITIREELPSALQKEIYRCRS